MLICFCFSWILEVFHSFFADFCKSVSTFPTGRQEPRCFRFFWCVYQWFFEMYTFKAATHEERRARHDSGAMRKKKQKQKRHIFEEMMKLKQLAWYWLQRLQVLPESPTWKRLTPRTEKDDASIHRACAYPSVCACIHVQCIYLATYLSPISRHVDKHDSKTLRGVSPVRLPVLEWAARAWFCSGIYCSLPGHIQILSFSGHTQIFI